MFANGTMVHPSENGLSAMDIMRAIDDANAKKVELVEEYECEVLNADNAVVRFSGDYGYIAIRCPFKEVEAEMIKHDKSKYTKELLAEILCNIALNKRDEDARRRVILYENAAANKHAEPEKNESATKIDAFLASLSTVVH